MRCLHRRCPNTVHCYHQPSPTKHSHPATSGHAANLPKLMIMLLLNRLGCSICWSGRTQKSLTICTASAFWTWIWLFSTIDSMKCWCTSLRIVRHSGPYCITSRCDPPVMVFATNDSGRLLYLELFLSTSSLTMRRSVTTTAVPVPSLREYSPPYLAAHSVNLCL